MTPVVKAADAAQFLSLIPRMLGYTPTRSVVVVPMHDGRSLGGLRVDLPPDDDADAASSVASTVIGMVCRIDAADAVTVAIYGDASARVALPYRPLAEANAARADACGLGLVDAVGV
ncbi:DUF4192 family protein, partial [Microbacterium sp.]|uniref:DUF4192 family protein n=1 Tax=Microbacterium sp. TaxID=51671 RepID=UPI003A8C2221